MHRLTKKKDFGLNKGMYEMFFGRYSLHDLVFDENVEEEFKAMAKKEQLDNAITTLGQYEDVMEKYNIEDIRELDRLLQYLKQIKTVEKDNGIDFITLFKALKNGLIYKTDDGYEEGDYHWTYIEAEYISLGMSHYEPFFELKLSQTSDVHYLYLDDYGKEWALSDDVEF